MPSVCHASRVFALFLLFATAAAPVLAQEATAYKLGADSKMWIDGTSTRSDWTVHANDIEGNFSLIRNGEAVAIRQAQFAVRATEIESGRSTIMDRLIDEALKVEEHPVIRYDFASAQAGAEAGSFNTTGKLTLGGQSNDVSFVVKAEPRADGTVRLTGTYPLKMSDYGLQAPVAMFGALRTGDEVTVHFDVVATPAN
jgi:polyisoprenoid-binding protein YceI